jgi:phasin
MPDAPSFEIPESLRDLAERNVEQARAAYTQFMDMARQAQEVVGRSSDAVAAGAREVQTRALRYAQETMDASFAFISDLARARDLKEVMEIQTRFAQQQLQSYTQQLHDLSRLMAETAQKAQRRT